MEERKEQRRLWQNAFGDTEKYTEYFFEKKAGKSRMVTDWERGLLCSMAFFIPYEVVLYGKKREACYIVGVATEEKFRHQGRMTKLLRQGMKEEMEAGNPLVFLSPAEPAIYEHLLFLPVYWRDTLRLRGEGSCRCEMLVWEQLDEWQKQRCSDFAEKILDGEKFDFRMVHSVAYYEEIHRELQALDGGLLTFWDNGEPLAVVHWICEDGKNEVTEWLGARERCSDVIETLLHHRRDVVDVEDTHFLKGISVPDSEWLKQKHPYLMIRMLDTPMPMPKRCYINDIT